MNRRNPAGVSGANHSNTMKTLAVALLTVLAGAATTAARADHSRVNVDFGITFGSSYSAPVCVEPAPVAVVPVHRRHYVPARGYWDTITVKSWVPGRWVVGRDRWGHRHRFFEKGHYVYRTERVWVDGRRGPAYGYNDGHRRWNR